jgi:putative membrane protein
MIVRDRPSAIRLLLSLRGSILGDIWKPLVFSIAVATTITLLGGRILGVKVHLDVAPFTLIGMTLAIFLGFRNNVCYDRYWEGRKLWGELAIACRNLARQVSTLMTLPAEETAVSRDLVYRIIAIPHAMRHELRGSSPTQDLQTFVDAETLEQVCAARSPTTALIADTARRLQTCRERGWIDNVLATVMETQLAHIGTAFGGCERIKTTPVPFAYTLLMHRTIFIYCVLVPFGLLDSCGMATPLIAAVLAYTFFGLDAVGTQIEEPFGTLPYALPLAAVCRTIEIDLRQALGETDVPPPLQPVNYVLS